MPTSNTYWVKKLTSIFKCVKNLEWDTIQKKPRVLRLSQCLSGSTAPFASFRRYSMNKAIYICNKCCIANTICYIESSNIRGSNWSKWIHARRGKPKAEGQPKPSPLRELKFPTVSFTIKFLFREARQCHSQHRINHYSCSAVQGWSMSISCKHINK